MTLEGTDIAQRLFCAWPMLKAKPCFAVPSLSRRIRRPIQSKKFREEHPPRVLPLKKCATTEESFGLQFGTGLSEYDIADGNYDIESWASVFDNIEPAPDGYWVEKIDGTIPADLYGTYYRNGPGDINFLNEPVAHPWDANGIMVSMAIKDGRAYFRSRFVETEHSMLEEKAGRRLFKGAFGTLPKNGVHFSRQGVSRNAASGRPILTGNRLYAPYEGSATSELDPTSLETLHPSAPSDVEKAPLTAMVQQLADFAWGQLKDILPSPSRTIDMRREDGIGDTKTDDNRGVTICHGYRFKPMIGPSLIATSLKIFEIDGDGRLKCQQNYTINQFTLVHAIGVTQNNYIVNKLPLKMEPLGLLDPTTGPFDAIQWEKDSFLEFHLIPRPGRDAKSPTQDIKVYKTEDASIVYHYVNAYEVDDKIVIDAIHLPSSPNNKLAREARYRYKTRNTLKEPIPRLRRTICSRDGSIETRELSKRAVELPSINPQYVGLPYQYAYMIVGLHPFLYLEAQCIGKVHVNKGHLELWTKGSYYFAGEPVFVPRPKSSKEDDGWLVCFCYNGKTKKSEFVILDAQNIENGPVATLYLDHAVGHGFHGIWTDSYFGK